MEDYMEDFSEVFNLSVLLILSPFLYFLLFPHVTLFSDHL